MIRLWCTLSRTSGSGIAAYYSNVLVVAIIPGMHFFFMP
jgi:hypothetical protein